MTHFEAFLAMSKAFDSASCWLWPHAVDKLGYARAEIAGRTTLVHREMYERLRGPIPAGKILHHTCQTPRCANPAHLEIMTQGDHVHTFRPRTHFFCGHPITPENSKIERRGTVRRCRRCWRLTRAKIKAKRKARGIHWTKA